MNQVSLSTTAGKIFWASLFGYCLAFGAFYFNTQYAIGELESEMRFRSTFNNIGRDACHRMNGCTGFTYLPYLVMNNETKKYVVEVSVNIKNTKNIDYDAFQAPLERVRSVFPWYVNQKLDSIKIVMVNNRKINVSEKKPDWYLSLVSKLEQLI